MYEDEKVIKENPLKEEEEEEKEEMEKKNPISWESSVVKLKV